MNAAAPTSTFARLRLNFETAFGAAVDEHLARLDWGPGQVSAKQAAALRELLEHAVATSPFHRRRLAHLDLGRIDPAALGALPVMSKAEMMAELDDVFTDRRLNRALVEEALARTGAEPVPILDTYTAIASGGSSGQRGLFVFDRATWVGFGLSVTRGLISRLRSAGAPAGFPIAFVAAGSAVHATASAAAWSSGGRLPFRFVSVPVTLPFAEVVRRLSDLALPGLSGYPAMLARLAAEQLAGRLNIRPEFVSSTSETLTPTARALITEAFGVPVTDIYASSEGLVGVSPPGRVALAFNSDLCIVELVDRENRPVPPGAPAEKILLTNLYNWTQPLIRYELSDVFAAQPAESGFLHATVAGRADELLVFAGLTLHPLVVRGALLRHAAILDYQVRQTPAGLDVDIVTNGRVDPAAIAAELRHAVAEAGLPGLEVAVSPVDALARQPDTGKLRRVIPL